MDLGWGKGRGRRAPLSRSLTCLLTSSRLRATPLSALLRLASFWHFPLLHSLCLMTWDGGGVVSGWAGWNPAPPVAPPQRPAPAYLISVVEELQNREDAGPNEQPHLAPNVTCEGWGGGHGKVSGVRTPWKQPSLLGQGQASHICKKIDSFCTEGAQSNSGGVLIFFSLFFCIFLLF